MLRSIFKYFVLTSLAFTLVNNVQARDHHPIAVASSETTNKSNDDKTAGTLEVELVGAHQTDKEETTVIAALQRLLQGLAHRNLDQIGSCLSQDVTTFDSKTKVYVYGKEAVIEHIKKNVLGTEAAPAVKRLVVYDPFVHIKGDTAMVSFRATKDLADKNSTSFESWCSEVFERKDGQWLVLQLKTDWKAAKSKSEK